jgi:hypothetical protein
MPSLPDLGLGRIAVVYTHALAESQISVEGNGDAQVAFGVIEKDRACRKDSERTAPGFARASKR